MLKYFKQKGQKLTANYNGANKNDDDINIEDDDSAYDDLDVGVMGDVFMCHSRLSMSLQAIVTNPHCLSYFVQFLERRQALALIKFYLDTENYRTAALNQLEHERRQSLLRQTKAATVTPISTATTTTTTTCHKEQQKTDLSDDVKRDEAANENDDVGEKGDDDDDDEDDEKQNTVPELKTPCESMCKPLTDDEKSQICAASNKQQQQQQQHNQHDYYKTMLRSISSEEELLSLCSSEQTTTNTAWTNGGFGGGVVGGGSNINLSQMVCAASVRDAMAIYQKYLRNDAKYFVTLPVALMSEISLLLCKRKDEHDVATTTKLDKDATTTADVDDDGDKQRATDEPHVSANLFVAAQQHVLQQLEREHLNDFLQSSFYCKYCIELIESSSGGGGVYSTRYDDSSMREEALNIYDVLHSEVTLFFFMEYLEQCGGEQRALCLEFWTAAINFRKSCMQQHEEQSQQTQQQRLAEMQADAMIIYDKYLSLQSTTRLRLLDKLRSHVEERICSDDGDGDVDAGDCGDCVDGGVSLAHCFDMPLQLIVRHLERRHFKDFLRSQLFQNYINELKSKAHEDATTPSTAQIPIAQAQQPASTTTTTTKAAAALIVGVRRKMSLRRSNSNNNNNNSATQRAMRHRKTLSDCSTTTTTNTLLASMDNNLKQSIQTAAVNTNLNIDSRQLTNPNLLWRRASASGGGGGGNGAGTGGGLQFGYVNALGRYERDFISVEAFANGAHSIDGKQPTLRNGGGGSSVGATSTWSLKNAVRKLVHLPAEQDRLQEEIAWQMAEMIVRDVTNVTLRGSGCGSGGADGVTCTAENNNKSNKTPCTP